MSDEKVIKPESEWKKQLTPTQYQMLREKATERPFTGEYVHHKRTAPTPVPRAVRSCFVLILNSIPAAAGQASGRRLTRTKSNCATTLATACSEPKCCAAAVAAIWGISSMMARNPRDKGIASIRRAWLSRHNRKTERPNDERQTAEHTGDFGHYPQRPFERARGALHGAANSAARQISLPSSSISTTVPMPIDDAGEGIKDAAFAEKMTMADALVIVTPEYNHSFPGLLKHVMDSCLKEYIHKAAGIVGVSAGPFGGVRAIQDFLPVIRELGLVNIFWDVNFGNVASVFDESGKLLDQAFIKRADKFLDELVWMAKTLRYGRDQYRAGS